MTIKIECVLQCDNLLGEGPVWDEKEGRLYWVDGTGRRVGKPSLWRLNPRTRLNAGKCDQNGRFSSGDMDDKEELKNCSLWRHDPDLRVTKLEEGIICSNAPCWSPDDKTFYLADSFEKTAVCFNRCRCRCV